MPSPDHETPEGCRVRTPGPRCIRSVGGAASVGPGPGPNRRRLLSAWQCRRYSSPRASCSEAAPARLVRARAPVAVAARKEAGDGEPARSRPPVESMSNGPAGRRVSVWLRVVEEPSIIIGRRSAEGANGTRWCLRAPWRRFLLGVGEGHDDFDAGADDRAWVPCIRNSSASSDRIEEPRAGALRCRGPCSGPPAPRSNGRRAVGVVSCSKDSRAAPPSTPGRCLFMSGVGDGSWSPRPAVVCAGLQGGRLRASDPRSSGAPVFRPS